MTIAEDRAAAIWDAEETRRARAARIEAIARWLIPVAVVFATLGLWHWFVTAYEVPHYILPSPGGCGSSWSKTAPCWAMR